MRADVDGWAEVAETARQTGDAVARDAIAHALAIAWDEGHAAALAWTDELATAHIDGYRVRRPQPRHNPYRPRGAE